METFPLVTAFLVALITNVQAQIINDSEGKRSGDDSWVHELAVGKHQCTKMFQVQEHVLYILQECLPICFYCSQLFLTQQSAFVSAPAAMLSVSCIIKNK